MKDVAVPDNMFIDVEIISEKNVKFKTLNYSHEVEDIPPPKDQNWFWTLYQAQAKLSIGGLSRSDE